MDMKKITCAFLVAAAAATMTAAETMSPAAAPGPASGSSVAVPVIGSLLGASLLSFFAAYMQ
ncbi:hypothetical protein Scep_014246 [Stephania cephalantha]|uniref:Arabinogalactan peptide 23-like n=1 Tax=Stephania cephalantha TaxID=152367 RepID=A0AAP0J274_9MAGN